HGARAHEGECTDANAGQNCCVRPDFGTLFYVAANQLMLRSGDAGYFAFVNTTFGPSQHRSSRTDSSGTNTFECRRTPLPRRTWCSTLLPEPMLTSSPI